MTILLNGLSPQDDIAGSAGRSIGSAISGLVGNKVQQMQRKTGLMGLVPPEQAQALSQLPPEILQLAMHGLQYDKLNKSKTELENLKHRNTMERQKEFSNNPATLAAINARNAGALNLEHAKQLNRLELREIKKNINSEITAGRETKKSVITKLKKEGATDTDIEEILSPDVTPEMAIEYMRKAGGNAAKAKKLAAIDGVILNI